MSLLFIVSTVQAQGHQATFADSNLDTVLICILAGLPLCMYRYEWKMRKKSKTIVSVKNRVS